MTEPVSDAKNEIANHIVETADETTRDLLKLMTKTPHVGYTVEELTAQLDYNEYDVQTAAEELTGEPVMFEVDGVYYIVNDFAPALSKARLTITQSTRLSLKRIKALTHPPLSPRSSFSSGLYSRP